MIRDLTNVIAVRRFRPSVNRPQRPRGARMTLYPEDGQGRPLYVPYAPSEVSYDGIAGQWETVERPGRAPALVFANSSLPKITFTLFIKDKLIQTSAVPRREGLSYQTATDALGLLKRFAQAGTRLRVAYSTMEAGTWRITNLQLRSVQRDPTTDEVIQAEAQVELTQTSDITVGVGPVTGGVTPPPVPSKPLPTAPAPTRYYNVVRGDTLYAIAIRFYKNGEKWRTIADANGIKDPRKLQIGTRLRIP